MDSAPQTLAGNGVCLSPRGMRGPWGSPGILTDPQSWISLTGIPFYGNNSTLKRAENAIQFVNIGRKAFFALYTGHFCLRTLIIGLFKCTLFLHVVL